MASVPLTSDDPSVTQFVSTAQWGLYKDGKPVIAADTVTALGLKATSEVSNYPLEPGAATINQNLPLSVQSYNKVQLPFSGRVKFSTGGSQSDRVDFLNSVEAAKQSLDLYDLVMPEKTYPSVNVTDYEFDRRAAAGLGLLSVDIAVEEIRITAAATFTNVKNPVSASPVNDGVAPISPAPPDQVTKIQSRMNGGGGW